MAVFNPDVPNPDTKDPNYLGYAKVIEGAKPDLSNAIRNTGAVNAVGSLPGIADKWMQENSRAKTEANYDALQDAHIKNLEAVTNPSPITPAPVQTATGTKTESLMDSQASMDVPPSIQSGLQRMSTLSVAAEGGKANDTLLTQQAYAMQKKLRAEFPLYRPYIDAEASKILGKDPANAYAQNMLQDLNATLASKKSETDKMLTSIKGMAGYKSADGTTMKQMYQYVAAGGPDAAGKALQWLDEVNRTEVNAKIKTAEITSANQDDAEMKNRAAGAFQTIASSKVNNSFYANSVVGGLETPQKIAARITEEGLKPGTYSAQQMEDAGRQILAKRNIMEQELLYEASRPIVDRTTGKPAVDRFGNQYSMLSLNGPEKTKEMIGSALKPYDVSSNAALNQQTGTATYAATIAQRAREDLDKGITTDPANEAINKMGWMNKNLGPQMTDSVYKNALQADIDTRIQNLLTQKTVGVFTGSETGKQATLKGDIEDGMSGKNTGGQPIAPETKYYDRVAENIHNLLNPEIKDNVKFNMIKYYFSPEGVGVLDKFKEGYYDDKHNWVPGKEALWNTLTNKSVTDEIKRISNLPGGKPYAEFYRNWMEKEFAQNIFGPAIHNLNEPPKYEDFNERFTGSGNRGITPTVMESARIGWVNEDGKNKFVLLDKKNQPLDPDYVGNGTLRKPREPGERGVISYYQQTLDRLNRGLENLAGMEKTMGVSDVNTYLLNQLTRAGFTPDETTQGLPSKMMEAIINSHKKPMGIKDVFKKDEVKTPGGM